jgi:hypothetical protein
VRGLGGCVTVSPERCLGVHGRVHGHVVVWHCGCVLELISFEGTGVRFARLSAKTCGLIDENQEVLGSLGAVAFVLRAFEEFAGNVDVLTNACGALRAIVCRPENQIKVTEMGGLQAVLGVIRREMDHVKVVRQGVACLWNLCKREANQEVAAELGAIRTIMDCLNNHPDDIECQTLCCGAMRALAVVSTCSATTTFRIGRGCVLVCARVCSSVFVARRDKRTTTNDKTHVCVCVCMCCALQRPTRRGLWLKGRLAP